MTDTTLQAPIAAKPASRLDSPAGRALQNLFERRAR